MKRLLNTLIWDIQLQFRNGFYYASAFVAVFMIGLLLQLPDDVNWALWWPPLLLENLVMNSFFFTAGLVLLEKGEGTLEAQIVTPLRNWEYLASKLISITILSLLESTLMVLFVYGWQFNWLWYVIGILFLIAILSLYGFWVVSRYSSISEFILPSVMWTLGISLPLLYYFNIWKHWSMFLHPMQPILVLLQAGFQAVPTWQILYGLGYGLFWIVIVYWMAQNAFYRFVVTKEGVKA